MRQENRVFHAVELSAVNVLFTRIVQEYRFTVHHDLIRQLVMKFL
jgi:hypothetical protein